MIFLKCFNTNTLSWTITKMELSVAVIEYILSKGGEK